MGCPCETRTSTCRSFATISSGLYRFLAITVLLDVKHIPQVGPLQWGRTKLTIMIECRNGVAFRQRDQLLAPHIKERVGGDNKRSWCRNRKGRINLGFTACGQDVYFYCDGASHFLNSFRLSIENRPRWVQEHGDGVDRWNQLA